MVKSMTGYGRAQQQIGQRDITVEFKAVNHRFFEFGARVPRSYGYLEEKLKTFVGGRVSRGKMEANVTIVTLEGASAEVQVNFELARSYVDALRILSEPLELRDDLSLSAMARFSDIFAVHRVQEDEEEVWQAVQNVAAEALERFVAMRQREGERLREDILQKLKNIEGFVSFVEERSPQTVAQYQDRLYQKLSELLGDRTVDEGRILTEAAVFADRVAVDEETVRLRSHIAQFRKILDAPEAIGRKLDFLVQEINRETNTIGSKAQDVEIAKVVVEMKSEIEKIREQIQNIE